MPFADVPSTCEDDLSAWWPIKAIPAALFANISITTIFVAPLLDAATRDTEDHSTNNITEREMSLKDSSIVSTNSGALLLATKNGLITPLL